MAEPNYNFSGLQKKAAPLPTFNFSGLKPKEEELGILEKIGRVGSEYVSKRTGKKPEDLSTGEKIGATLVGTIGVPVAKILKAGAGEEFAQYPEAFQQLADAGGESLAPLRSLAETYLPKQEDIPKGIRIPIPVGGGFATPELATLTGATRGAASLVESFGTPKNLAIMVGTQGLGLLPIIGKVGLPAVEAFFAYEAAKQVPELWRAYQAAPAEQKPELLTQLVGSIGIAGLASAGAAKKTAGLGRELKSLTDVAPEVATVRPVPTGELFTLPTKVTAGRSELERAAKTAEEVGQRADAFKAEKEFAIAKDRAKQALGQEPIVKPTPKQDIGALAKDLEGVVGPQLSEADLGVPAKKARPESADLTTRQALQEDWQSKQVQDGDFLRDPTAKDVFEKTTGLGFTDSITKEFANWRKAKGSEFELGDAEVFASEKRAKLPKDRALATVEKPKEIKIVDLAPPIEKPVDNLTERRRVVAEKRQTLTEERLKLQEQRLEAQKQRAIEQLSKKYKVTGLKKRNVEPQAPKGAEGATKGQFSAPARPSEQYAQGQKTVEGLIAKYKDQAIPKSEWSGLAKDELTKQGYSSRVVSELTEPKRTALEQAPGFETSRAGRSERAIEPTPELRPKVDELANAAKPNQIAQADYERGRQEILAELEKDPNLKVYYDSGEGFYKVEVLQKNKLTPKALAAVQELRRQAALEGGYSLETVGRGHEIAVTPEDYYEGKPLSGTTLAEKIGDLVERKKNADATHEAFVKAKNKAEPDLVDRYLTEEGAAPLLGRTAAGEGVEIVTRRNRSAVEPDAPEWVKQIEQAKKIGQKQLGDPYVSIYRVTEKTANKAAGEGFTFLRKNLSEADNAKLDAVVANMAKAANELSANPTFNIKIGLEAYKNLAEFGFLTLKASGKALLTKAEWASRMLSELGESVRPFLDDIWKSIQSGWKPGTELEMPKAFAERTPKAVEAKATLAKEEPPTGGDKLNEWARNVKLASTSSLLRSFAGNLTMQMLKTPKRAIAAGVNRALAAVTGAKRDRFGQEAATELYGTLRSLKQGVEEAKQVIRENPEALKNSLFLSQETGRTSGAIEGRKGYYIRMPQKLQGAIDALSRVPSGQGLIDMLAVRQAFKEGLQGEAWINRVEQLQNETRAGNTEIGKQLLAEAKTEAAEMTFQAELGKIAQKVNAVRDVPGVRFLVPFFNTWVNLWKQGIRHTPLNVLRLAFIRSVQKAFDKNPELRSIGSLSDEIAAMTTGTAFTLTTFGALTKLLEGDIVGYGPEDQKERQRLFASGWKPYSLKLGDTYVSFKGFEPVSTWLTMMADANEGRKKEGALGAFDGISANVVRNFIENPFLTGITETMDALRGESKPEEFLAGMALGATVPTFLQQTARVIDPKYRQTPKDADALEKFAAEYTKRVPFLSKTLPSELDIFGKERTVASPALRYLAVNISKQDRGVIQDELRRLDMGIGFPRDTFKGLELTEPQVRELLVLAGGRMEKALAKMVVSPGYKQLRDEEKKSAINYVINKVREDSKEFLFKHLATKKAQPKNRGSAVARPFAR